MREKGQTEVAKTLETPVFSRGIEILTEKYEISKSFCGICSFRMVKHSSKSFFLYPIIGSVKKANPKSEYNFIARKLDGCV